MAQQQGAGIAKIGGGLAVTSAAIGFVPGLQAVGATGVALGGSIALSGATVSLIGAGAQWVGSVMQGQSAAAGFLNTVFNLGSIMLSDTPLDLPSVPGVPDPADVVEGAAGITQPQPMSCQ